MTEKLMIKFPQDKGEPKLYRSASEFLIKLAKEQWSETGHIDMKVQLSKRALFMTGKFIHPFQYDEPFVKELGRIGFLEVNPVE